MNINGQKIDIKDLINEKYMHKEIKKGLYLSEYQMEILKLTNENIDFLSSSYFFIASLAILL